MEKEEILGKLKSTGFLTELEVAKVFRDNDLRLELNKYYNDIDEDKGREIDLIAEFSRKTDTDEENYLEMSFKFVVEIKKSRNPWVFTSSKADDFWEHETPFFIIESENFQQPQLTETIIEEIKMIDEERLGRNFTVINSDKGDIQIYKALSGVTKAFYHEKFLENYIEKNRGELSEKIFEYFELLVVVDADIYEVFLGEAGEQIEKVDSMLVAFYYKSPKYDQRSVYFIRVINKDSLDSFLKERKESFGMIAEKVLEKEGGGRPFME